MIAVFVFGGEATAEPKRGTNTSALCASVPLPAQHTIGTLNSLMLSPAIEERLASLDVVVLGHISNPSTDSRGKLATL